jgi:hypothetical protein
MPDWETITRAQYAARNYVDSTGIASRPQPPAGR